MGLLRGPTFKNALQQHLDLLVQEPLEVQLALRWEGAALGQAGITAAGGL